MVIKNTLFYLVLCLILIIAFSYYKNKEGFENIATASVSGRYIKLQQKQVGCLNLGEIEVYSNNENNIITPKTIVTKSSNFGDPDAFPGSFLVDGNKNSFAHTSCNDSGWFLIDLGKTVPINKIVITNRSDCCRQRANGIVLTILDTQQNVIYTANPITDKKNRTSYSETRDTQTTFDDYYLTFTYFPPDPSVIGDIKDGFVNDPNYISYVKIPS